MPPIAFDSPLGLALLFLAGMIAAGVNAVAGGGSLVSFPTLIGLGLPAREANATNSVALWPGSLAGALGFLNQISRTKKHLRVLLLPSLVGSLMGAWLLVVTTDEMFKAVVPVLLLLATLLLAFQKRIRAWGERKRVHVSPVVGVALQLLVSVYGGYFGAGMGIMMLAVMGLFIEANIHELNAIKNWLGLLINFAASALLLSQNLVWLIPGLALMLGAIVGGYASARLSQKVDAEKLRRAIVVYGFVMTSWFLYRLWFP